MAPLHVATLTVQRELPRYVIPRLSYFINRVKDYIVTRPPLPLREGGAEQAVLHFQQQASSIATQLVTELKDLNEGNVARKPSKEPTGTLGEEDPEERYVCM